MTLKWLVVRLWWKDVFVLSRAWDEEKILSPHEESMFSSDVLSSFLYWAQKLTFPLISIYKHYAYRHCWSKLYAGYVSYELRNRSRLTWSLCGSVVRASQRRNPRSAVRFVMGLRIFSFSHARDKTKTSLAQFILKSF